MSMFTKATKAQAKARIAFAGPTGSGKTWTSLVFATILGKRIALIDTERGSASLYAPHFDFDTLTMSPPYEPGRLVDALKAAEAEGYEVVVIDSLSHFWEGEGGTLDIADSAGQRSGGNSFAGWKVATPALRHLVDTLLGVDCHVIATMRSKMEYILEEDNRGKKVPKKVGMAPVMRAGVEYEFTMVGDLDLEHRLTFTKSRCDVLADSMVQPGRAGEAADIFKAWLDDGEPTASRNEIDAIRHRSAELDEEGRHHLRELWDASGLPPTARLLASQIEQAQALLALCESPANRGPQAPPPPPPDEAPATTDATAITEAQLRKLNTVLQKRGHIGPMRHAWAAEQLGRDVASLKEVTKDEANRLIDLIEREEADPLSPTRSEDSASSTNAEHTFEYAMTRPNGQRRFVCSCGLSGLAVPNEGAARADHKRHADGVGRTAESRP